MLWRPTGMSAVRAQRLCWCLGLRADRGVQGAGAGYTAWIVDRGCPALSELRARGPRTAHPLDRRHSCRPFRAARRRGLHGAEHKPRCVQRTRPSAGRGRHGPAQGGAGVYGPRASLRLPMPRPGAAAGGTHGLRRALGERVAASVHPAPHRLVAPGGVALRPADPYLCL